MADTQIKMPPSPNGGGPAAVLAARSQLTIGLSAVAFLGIGTAHPHDAKRPELNAWFKVSRARSAKPCCDTGDGEHAEAEVGYGKAWVQGPLRIRSGQAKRGQWFDVPSSAVIDRPNLSGIAMVWWSPVYDMDGTMTPKWRCFIPGAGG